MKSRVSLPCITLGAGWAIIISIRRRRTQAKEKCKNEEDCFAALAMAGRISNVEVNYVRRPDPSAALRMTGGVQSRSTPFAFGESYYFAILISLVLNCIPIYKFSSTKTGLFLTILVTKPKQRSSKSKICYAKKPAYKLKIPFIFFNP